MTPWVLAMWWHDVCFLHWRADAAIVARALPAGVELDRFNGEAWLSVVPFRMTDVRPRLGPVLPGLRSVPEINLRTYVRVRGRPGIWFFSLDASSRIAVFAARIATALPYLDARIEMSESAGRICYTSERTDRRAPGGRFRASYVPEGEPSALEPGSLDAFLHERYRFFARRGAGLVSAEIRHAPWSLQSAPVEIAENTLGDLIAHPLTGAPDRIAFARSLRVHATVTR